MAAFTLKPVAPFRLELTAWALRRRAHNVVDRWDGRTYSRVLALGRTTAEIAVEQTGARESPRLTVSVSGGRMTAERKAALRAAVERLLGVNADLAEFRRLAGGDRRLAALVERFAGLKPPRFASTFEAVLNGISCQQLSLHVGILLLNRLSQTFGLRRGANHAFPRPEDLAGARPPQLRKLGYSASKAEHIMGLARAVSSGRLDLEALGGLDDAAAAARLEEIPGIGRWTAQYVLLRGLGRLDIYFYLLLDSLSSKGAL